MRLILKTNKDLLKKLIIFFDIGIFYFLKKVLFGSLLKIYVGSGYNFFLLINSRYLYPILYFLRYHSLCLFKILIDLMATDYIGANARFTISYSLLSVKYNNRFLIKAGVKTYEELLSCASIFLAASWLEREVYEFYGIFFSLNKDLRHLLLDYGFRGYPLRKDFPISGFIEIVYSDINKKLSYRKLELVQSYRASYLKRFLV